MELIGALMREHRVIERIIPLLKNEFQKIKSGSEPDISFIDSAIEFIRTYADAVHHGKEEDILFRKLESKPISDAFKAVMNDLIADHKLSRQHIVELVKSRNEYEKGNYKAINDISNAMQKLIEIYPPHIAKEDKQFFFPSLEYFSREERIELIREGEEFDRQIIHRKYLQLIEELESSRK